MNRRTFIILASAITAIALCVAGLYVHDNLFLYGSKSLFILDAKIIFEELLTVGGAGSIVSHFIEQMLHLRVLAALIIAALAAASIILVDRLNRAVNPARDEFRYLAIMAAVYMVASLNQYLISLQIFISLVALLPIVLLSLRSRCVVVASILTIVAYLLLGEIAIILPVITLLRRDRVRWSYIPLIIFAVLPLYYAAIEVLPYNEGYLRFMDRELAVYVVLTVASVALGRFMPPIKSDRLRQVVLPTVMLAAILIVAAYKFSTDMSAMDRLILKSERAIIESDNQGLYELSLECSEGSPVNSYSANIALLAMDEFAEKIFTVQQFGLIGLNLGESDNSFKGNGYTHIIYARLGIYSQAYRHLFEASVISGFNRVNLNLLVQYNEMLGREKIAQKYQRILDKTLFSGDFRVELLSENVDCEEIEMRVCNMNNICIDLMLLADNQTLTKRQADYLMVGLLLSNRLYEFAKYSYYVEMYYDYSNIPDIYNEAFMLLKIDLSRSEFAAQGLLEPSLKAGVAYERYNQLLSRSNSDPEKIKEFSETLYFYIDFLSPYGPKISKKISDRTDRVVNRKQILP